MTARVSIVVPAFNAQAFLQECLASCLAQQCRDIEVIVVDDGSTDNSASIAEKMSRSDPRLRALRVANGGAPRARNHGLHHAIGEFVLFHDADDILPRQAVSALLSCTNDRERPLPFGAGRRFGSDPASSRLHFARHLMGRPAGYVPDLRWILANTPPTSCSLYTREALLEIGGFREDLGNRQDIDLFMRMVLAGYTPVYVDEVCELYRSHSSSTRISRRSRAELWKSQLRMLAGLRDLCDRTGGPRADLLRQELAVRAWKWGRELIRVNLEREAAAYFALSAELSGNNRPKGPRWYVGLASALGVKATEQVLEMAKARIGWYR